MVRSLASGERPFREDYRESECLYRDHLGRRVIADIEGSGHYSVLGEVPLEIEVDGCPVSVLSGPFHGSLLVTTSAPGEVSVSGALSPLIPEGLSARLLDSFSIADLKAREFRVQNMSAITVLSSTTADGEPLEHPVASHLNKFSWRCPIPPGCKGLVLRRLYDRFHGRQRARVLIDGTFVAWWYEATQDRIHRWTTSAFPIPGEFLVGKETLEITIDPPGGSPLFSVAAYEVFEIV